jgi:hypothetical protein
LDLEGIVGKVYPARPLESEMGHFTPRRHMCAVCLRDKRRICLIELIDANRKKTVTGKRLAACPQNIDGETHYYNFIATVCTHRTASVPIIPTTFDTVAQVAIATISVTRSKLWWPGRRGLLARRYIHTERDGRREVRMDMMRVNAHALEALLVSPSVAKASLHCQILRMDSTSLQYKAGMIA